MEHGLWGASDTWGHRRPKRAVSRTVMSRDIRRRETMRKRNDRNWFSEE